MPFDDSGFTGKYADIVVNLPHKGRLIFSREYSYQPYWEPSGGRRFPVDRLIPRIGDGPAERPDKNNICSNAAIIEKSDSIVKVHWRYAPDMTRPSFVDFLSAYNETGNPSEFYSEYADEYFTISSDGTVFREVKKGCYSFDDWNDPKNIIIQKLRLIRSGIKHSEPIPSKLQNLPGQPVKGLQVKDATVEGSAVNFKFDEGLAENGYQTTESVTNTVCQIKGVEAYWREGVSGTCLSFDSYSNAVVLPSSKCPEISDGLTIEAWVAPQEYPFNRAAIVDHLDGKKGYFLGMDVTGRIGFRVGLNDSVTELMTAPVPLYKWTHIAATFSSGKGLSVYINGNSAAFRESSGIINDAVNKDIFLGMTQSFAQYPIGSERPITKGFKTNMVFSGLIDEIRIFKRELSLDEIASDYKVQQPEVDQPLNAWILPDGPVDRGAGFGAQYSKLQYAPEWDGLWRVGDFADLTVTFDQIPWRYVFWRGTRYLPSLVTEYGPESIWSSDQSPESFSGQCFEHMSDMLCRYSKIRLISGTDARVVVHWRNSSANIAYQWPETDSAGWGIWTDEYWTIYPDGASVRHQVVNNNTSAVINCEMNQNEILHHPGQTTSDVLFDEAVIGVDINGETRSWYHSKEVAQPERRAEMNLQFTNLKSKTKQFEIGEIGTWIETFLTVDDYWNGWNHYPVQLIPGDGTDISQYDRPSSTCPSTLHEVRRTIDKKTIEAMVLYGLTLSDPEGLTGLNRSWNYAPEISDVNGCISHGYEKRERAYKIKRVADEMRFKILATEEKPLANLAIIIYNWGNNNADDLSLTLNGRSLYPGKDYRKGIELDTEGENVLVLWLEYSSTGTTTFLIQNRTRS